MNGKKDIMDEHSAHLLKPNPKWLQNKLKLFGVKPTELKPVTPICGVIKGPVRLDSATKYDPHVGELDRYSFTATPKTLDDLKELVGIPNRNLKNDQGPINQCCQPNGRLRDVSIHHLPIKEKYKLAQLNSIERKAVLDMSHNMLYGYVSENFMTKDPVKALIDFMLEQGRLLPTFVADTLIVCPNETVEIKNYAVVYITNVVVYGSGTIKLDDRAKLHSYQIKHV
jgi:hypothetical protein